MSRSPDISILIPTLEEQHWVAHCVRTARASAASAGVVAEIIVCDGSSTDDTVAEARRAGADQVIRAHRTGRSRQLNEGWRLSLSDTVAFLHADSLITPEAIADIISARADGYDGGWFEIEIRPEGSSLAGSNLLDIMAWGINLRTRLFRTATADQCIFASRTVLEVLGGLPEIPLFEGNRFAREMRDIGPIAVLGPNLRISGRRWEQNGLLYMLLLMYALRLAERFGTPTTQLYRVWSRISRL